MSSETTKAFRKCLARINLSGDLKTSLGVLYDFFQQHLPLDFCTAGIYDAAGHTLRYRIHATDAGIVLVDELLVFSEDTRPLAQEIIARKQPDLYVPNGQEQPLLRQFDSLVGIDHPASIILHFLEISADRFIIIAFVVWGRDRYRPEHMALISGLSEMLDNALRHIHSQIVIAGLRERLTQDNRQARTQLARGIIGSHGGLAEVMASVERVAKHDTPVILLGETGVGKELIANAIHLHSRRADGPMVSINCGAMAETLLDSELFGHEKGAFTGASTAKMGFFEQAHGGTIFLDEVSELSRQAQVRLLRVLQNMTFQRVGGQRTISVDVRVIAASNRDIEGMVRQGEFRQDLWFRLNTFPIVIPPLRGRSGDIPDLADFFARRLSVEMNLPFRYRFAPGAMRQLRAYDWPGNVRQLENVIEQALIVSKGAPLSFPLLAYMERRGGPDRTPGRGGEPLTLDRVIAGHITDVLRITGGRIEGGGGAAQLLGVKPSTLRARMKKLGISIRKVPTGTPEP